jgi:16S rRNA A1518/A1519 N6-dimethyltransferase RsmA/KsgA/DIM1 with predicted DNA glycosylase/AP lyase activity
LFVTPDELAARAVEKADIAPGHRVLEPNAGTGALLRAIGPDVETVAVEIHATLAEGLMRGAHPRLRVRHADFLQCNGDLGTFDRILMNPPFENASDIKHIFHALSMLKPGGRLVAICANGPRQREKLQPIATEYHDLPAGMFKAAGTNVATALVVIDR